MTPRTLHSLSLSIIFYFVSSQDIPGPAINTPQGEIQGTWKTTINGRKIEAFMGIPFAKPPVGSLRFKEPKPYGNWSSLQNATKDPTVCPQYGFYLDLPEKMIENEDCLYLNVFTPDSSKKGNFPVMVFIHGGAFYFGGCISDIYGPDMLLDRDIVLVVTNYRLGILGFGSTEDEELPGNLGLKDQVLALKWVQENIAAYGGNAGSVTLFGQSAGGACVHYHMLSPLSKGLFHRAIPMSGTAYNSWAISAPGKVANFMTKFGEKLDCPTNTTKELMGCLRSAPVSLLLKTATNFSVWEGLDPMVIFTPVFEPEKEESFITAESYKSHTTVPMITGATTEEGTFRVGGFYLSPINLDTILSRLDENFESIGPIAMAIDDKTDNPSEVAKQVKQFFFGEKPISKETIPELVNMYSDVFFYEGEKIAVKRHNSIAYLYLFAFKGRRSFVDRLTGGKFQYGVSHADELQYLFPTKGIITPREGISFSTEEKRISEQLVNYFVNFATHGNPTPSGNPVEWTPTSIEDFNYLLINGSESCMHNCFLSERNNFWENIHWSSNVIPQYN